MAAQKPVIAPNWGGIPEIVIDRETGMLFEPGNVQALSECLAFAFENHQTLERMGERGFEIARDRFSASRHVAHIERIYNQLLSK
jgi:glycosyltransferase involved in cell wall biosynthesis